MAEEKKPKSEEVSVPLAVLTKMQEQMAALEITQANLEAKNAGLEAMLNDQKKADTVGGKELRMKKNFEPKFRTVGIKKFPIAGKIDDMGYIVGWTSRGAYEEVNRSGLTPEVVNFIDVVFLGRETNKEGKKQAEKIKLLDIFNQGVEVFCKIIDEKKKTVAVPTNEEIDVSVFDPAHGMVTTGEKVDGFFTYADIDYLLQIPGVKDPVWVNAQFCNAF